MSRKEKVIKKIDVMDDKIAFWEAQIEGT